MSNRPNSSRYVSALLRNFSRKKGFDRLQFIFSAADDVNGGRKTFFVELYALRSNAAPGMIAFGNHLVEQVFKDAEKQNRQQAVSYLLLRAGYYGQSGAQTYAVFPLSSIVFDPKEATLSCRAESSCPAWISISPTNFSGSIRMSERQCIPYAQEEFAGGGFAWNIEYTIQSVSTGSCRYRKTFLDLWGNRLGIAGNVLYNGRSFSVDRQLDYGFGRRFVGTHMYAPCINIAASVLESQVSGKKYSNGYFAFSSVSDGAAEFSLSYGDNIVSMRAGTRDLRKKKAIINFVPSGEQLHWMCSLHRKQVIYDIDVFASAGMMNIYNYEVIDSASLFQILAGASGMGEIRVYQRHGKDLELLEHLLLKNVFCEYGMYIAD